MKHIGFILAILLAGTASKADEIQVLGSRKHHHPQQSRIDVDEIIRAEEDPNFSQYLKERNREKKEQRAAALAYEKQREADEEAYQKSERQYFKEERERVAREPQTERKHRVNEVKAWAKQQEKYRREYLAEQYKQVEKFNSERMARIQKALSAERMPASSD